jgi:hypothetical protein
MTAEKLLKAYSDGYHAKGWGTPPQETGEKDRHLKGLENVASLVEQEINEKNTSSILDSSRPSG